MSKTYTREQQRRIVRKHYDLKRPVTDAELDTELVSLHRKHAAGSLCDFALALYCALDLNANAQLRAGRDAMLVALDCARECLLDGDYTTRKLAHEVVLAAIAKVQS
jgi:hypothetical protein